MKVVIVAATEKELALIKELTPPKYIIDNTSLVVSFVETGVGMLTSCFSLTKLILEKKPDLIMQVGIAGTFDAKVPLGKVVVVKEEILADTGVDENGFFKDLFDLNLLSPNTFPFSDKKLINPQIRELNFLNLEAVTGITINEITTRLDRIEQYKARYNAVIETMEGASLHYCCLQTGTSFFQLRAISNYIGERDKNKWNFKEAFKNLSGTVLLYLEHLYKRNSY